MSPSEIPDLELEVHKTRLEESANISKPQKLILVIEEIEST